MALVNCLECNHEVSDKASACPKCGAPVEKITSTNKLELDANSTSCPFCKKTLSSSAITCAYCGAEYGFYNHSFKRVQDTSGLKSVLLFTIGTLLLIWFLLTSEWDYKGPLLAGPGLILLILLTSVLPRTIFSKIKGKRWWKSR